MINHGVACEKCGSTDEWVCSCNIYSESEKNLFAIIERLCSRYVDERLTEGELAFFLGVDRLSVRDIVEKFHPRRNHEQDRMDR